MISLVGADIIRPVKIETIFTRTILRRILETKCTGG